MVEMLNCDLDENEFEIQSRYFDHFLSNTQGKRIDPVPSPAES